MNDVESAQIMNLVYRIVKHWSRGLFLAGLLSVQTRAETALGDSDLFQIDTRYGQGIAVAGSGTFSVDTRFSAGVMLASSDTFTIDTRAPLIIDAFVLPSPTALQANVVGFRLPTTRGESYLVKFKDSLTDPFWRWTHTIVGNGKLIPFFEEVKSLVPHRFYQITKETEQVILYLRLPLPGQKSWYLTVETGGESDCNGDIDQYHLPDAHYFSLDFDDLTAGTVHENDVSVLAAADGVVVRKYNSTTYGWTVIIDHDGSYDASSTVEKGYTTLYAHLRDEPLAKQGDLVVEGEKIGVLDCTGTACGGTHLHFEVRYNGDNRTSVEELRRVRLEGLAIEDYHVGCYSDGTGYYPSTNTEK